MEDADRITEDEVESFVGKLETWGGSLSAGEKALLQLVLERAAGRAIAGPDEVEFAFPATRGFGEVVTPFLREIVEGGALSVRIPKEDAADRQVWVEIGEIWLRATGSHEVDPEA